MQSGCPSLAIKARHGAPFRSEEPACKLSQLAQIVLVTSCCYRSPTRVWCHLPKRIDDAIEFSPVHKSVFGEGWVFHRA
jgi:hypothetical protein